MRQVLKKVMAGLERAVISQSILKNIDLNKPDFGLVPSEWQLGNCVDPNQPTATKRVLDDCQENQKPPLQKPRLSLSLKKGNSRFSKPLSADELKKAAEGVTPINTQTSGH